eukprot:TRINITY_DN3952_c0_g1_i10.p2 TRINITY_DN3952_c0_g1~~TRINITY_DN3952_c0_g1_i10.p2  ORF type:complete len:270 (-),score=102.21 TRINITY_DN3952_c0_g1_i10:55-864(-)
MSVYSGFNRVFEMIESDVALESLEMRSTQLPDGPVRRLARFAVRHPTLTSLDLSGNPITDVGGKALLQLVQKNRGVVSLKLEDTLVADNLIAKIQVELLTNKRSNKSRLRSGNGFSNDLQKARRQRQHTPAQRSTKQQHTAAAESAAPVVQEQPQQVASLCSLISSKTAAKATLRLLDNGKQNRANRLAEAQKIKEELDAAQEGQNKGRDAAFVTQGNLAMYTDESLLRRDQLAQNSKLKASIERWWMVAVCPYYDLSLIHISEPTRPY